MGYIYPVGRLDYDSEGLLLLTTDGELAERLTHPRHEVERVYEAIVAGDRTRARSKAPPRRVIDGRRTAPAEVRRGTTVKSGGLTTKLTISLREGRNRQVRKMCQAVGHPVRALIRVRWAASRRGLRPGEWRELTAAEVEALRKGAFARAVAVAWPIDERVSTGTSGTASYVAAARCPRSRLRPFLRAAASRPATLRSISTAGGSKPSCCAMSSIFGRSSSPSNRSG